MVKQYTKETVKMPRYYVADSVRVLPGGKTDTVFHQISDFHLVNQLGERVSFENIGPKVVLADFFFTSCPSICPRLTANLKKVQVAFAKNDSALQILSFSVDPEHDSVPKLRAYSDRYRVDQDRWWFLTGDKKQIYDLARNDFKVSVTEGDGGPEDFIHTEKWVLLDKHRYIRGYYNGLDSADVARCMHDIALLMLEREKR